MNAGSTLPGKVKHCQAASFFIWNKNVQQIQLYGPHNDSNGTLNSFCYPINISAGKLSWVLRHIFKCTFLNKSGISICIFELKGHYILQTRYRIYEIILYQTSSSFALQIWVISTCYDHLLNHYFLYKSLLVLDNRNSILMSLVSM